MKIHSAMSLCAAFAAASALADATVITWTGGDQSGSEDSSLDVKYNWEKGESEVYLQHNVNGDYEFAITSNGAYAKLVTASTGYSVTASVTVGAESEDGDDPEVTLELSGNRASNHPVTGERGYWNSNAADVRIGGRFKAVGKNTTLKINQGIGLNIRSNYSSAGSYLTLGEDVKLVGTGIFHFGDGARPIPAHDYDGMMLMMGQERGYSASDMGANHWLEGDIATTGDLYLAQWGSSGTGGRTYLDLNGHSASVASVTFGTKDNRTSDDSPYDQSSFGGLLLNGGTIKISGDIVFEGNPDGSRTWNTTTFTPNVYDHFISTGGNGGTIELGGSMLAKSRSPDDWNLKDATLALCGDGTQVQKIEALSADVGDKLLCVSGNDYAIGHLVVKAGAKVRLVDEFWNDRPDGDRYGDGTTEYKERAAGYTPEAVYAKRLTVEAGASLDLNGLKLYVQKEPEIAGTVSGGTVTRVYNDDEFSLAKMTLGTPGTEIQCNYGHWVASMAAGDIDGDGHPELVAITMDEDAANDNTGMYVLKYSQEGGLSSVAPFPVSGKTALDGAANGFMFGNTKINPIVVADANDGKGTRIWYSRDAWSQIHAMSVDGTAVESHSAAYGGGNFIMKDMDKDGVLDIVSAGRKGTYNVYAYSVKKGDYLWSAAVEGCNADAIAKVGVADLGDGSQTVMALGQGSNGASPFRAFKADGEPRDALSASAAMNATQTSGSVSAKDVTGDGVPEIFLVDGSSKTLVVLSQTATDENGNPTQVFTASTLDAQASPTVAFIDVDKDGVYEFFYDGYLYSGLNGTFTQVDAVPYRASNPNWYCNSVAPAFADMNGDGVPEIVYLITDSSAFGGANRTKGRTVMAYDFAAKKTLYGFPMALEWEGDYTYEQSNGTILAEDWFAGQVHHWYMGNIVIADFDGDGRWEIAVGMGAKNQIDRSANNASMPTKNRAQVNVIHTPYKVPVNTGRTEREISWWSFGHSPDWDFCIPPKKDAGFRVIIR